MTGINHRRKNPIHSAPSSRAAKVAQLRHSHRAFQKKPFPSRMAVKEEGGIKKVMGRVVFPRQGQVKKDGKDQRGSAGSGSRGGRDVKTPVQSESENHSTLDDSAARDMTVEELLEEANLAGLPDRFRTHSEPAEERHQSSIEDHRGNDEDGMIDENDYPDGAFSMEADEGRSESSEDPLMIYPTPSWSIVVPSVVGGVSYQPVSGAMLTISPLARTRSFLVIRNKLHRQPFKSTLKVYTHRTSWNLTRRQTNSLTPILFLYPATPGRKQERCLPVTTALRKTLMPRGAGFQMRGRNKGCLIVRMMGKRRLMSQARRADSTTSRRKEQESYTQ